MKNTIYSVLVAATGTMAFTACEDQLDIEHKAALAVEQFYITESDCKMALTSAYESFLINTLSRTECNNNPGIYTPARIMANIPGDDVYYASGNYGDHEFSGMLDEFRYDTQAECVAFHYQGLYFSVYTCNLVIDHFGSREDATEFMKQAVAEARVLRAYDYFLLANYWGTPPMVDHVLTMDDPLPTNSDLDPNCGLNKEGIIEWVAKECLAAEPDLLERESTADKNNTVRVTKGFANALAGKAYLFIGKYAEAKTALKKVIDSKKYALVSGDKYLDMFHIEGDCNEEKIFEGNMEYNPNVTGWSGALQRSTWMEANAWNWRAGNFVANPGRVYSGIDGWGGLGVQKWFGDEFFANDGHSYRFDATLIHIDDAVYGMTYDNSVADKRKFGDDIKYVDAAGNPIADDDKDNRVPINSLSRADKEKSYGIGIKDLTEGLYGESFWLPFKNIMRRTDCMKPDGSGLADGDNVRLNNIIVMRYAEVLLNYAEACIQTGAADEAKTYINMIQARAQKDGKPALSETVDMDVLKKEKSYELWLEGCRFLDVLRWNDPEGLKHLQAAGSHVPHLFDKFYRTPKATDEDIIWENGTEENSRFYMVHTHAAKDLGFEVGFQEKHRLFPFPQIECGKDPNLRQNPGW